MNRAPSGWCRRALLALAAVGLSCGAPPMTRSRQHGGTPLDLQGLIDRELEAGKKRVVVPPGRYRVAPHHREHLRLDGLRDIEIVADGVEMVCTETTRAVTLESCRNVAIADNTIRDGRGVAIAVYAFGGSGAVAPAGAHNRIAITGNTVADCPLPGILVTSTAGLTLDGNALKLAPDRRIAPWAIGGFRIKELGPVVQIHTRE